MKKYIYIIGLICLCTNIVAQDIHFSQFNQSPQNLNPAQTGLFNGDWRFATNYRRQWSSIPVSYKTYSISADTRFKKLLRNDVPAAGLIINTDNAGDSRFNTTQIAVSAAYIKKLNKDSSHFISIGVQPGVTTKSFDLNALTFDNQYAGDQYYASLPSGENFSKTRITYFDLGGGLVYLWQKNNRKKINVGISALHLNRPKQSFFNNDDIKLDVKYTVSTNAQIPISENLDIAPSFLFQSQGKFKETVVGLFGKYHLRPINGAETAISLGAFHRVKDAFIIAIAMDYKNVRFGYTYDFNTSKLNVATNRQGAFEISMIYIFKKMIPFYAKMRNCPIYM